MTRGTNDPWSPNNPNTDYENGPTPAQPVEGEHEGLDYYITGKDLKLLFCRNDSVIDTAEPTETRFVTAQGGFYEFFVRGKLNRIKSGDKKPYDVVVLANTKGMLHFDQEYLENLVGSKEDAIYPNLIYEYTAENVGTEHIHDIAHAFTESNFTTTGTNRDLTSTARVPMWGRTVGQYLNEGTPVIIPLMRSLAKIRIALHPSITTGEYTATSGYSYTIEKIEMVGASTRGTLMPKDAHHKVTTTSVPDGYQGVTAEHIKVKNDDAAGWWPDAWNMKGSQNIPEGTEHNKLELEFYKKAGTDGVDYFYTYVPETVNLTGQFHFNVYLKRTLHPENTSVSQRFRMEFGEYNINEHDHSVTGKYMPVMRNHYYMYTIKGVTQDRLIFIDPWDAEILPPIMM